MIPNQWYVVMGSKQVKKSPVGATRLGEKLVFWRDVEGNVSCLRNRCVHRGVALSAGEIVQGHLQCPFHGFEYDPSGKVIAIPANGKSTPVPEKFKVHNYPTFEKHGFIWIWWGDDPPENLKPPRFFSDIDESFYYGQVQDPWKAHYSRVIENQLDVMHLPFVHDSTIGRGNRTLVDGPKLLWTNDDMFRVFVYNRLDDGNSPRKPDEITMKERQVYLEFIFPNLWQNHISEDIRVLAAFVPVDDEHTILYLRFYQKFIPIPFLGKLIARMSMPFNVLVAHQDRRVVETQVPKISALRSGEKLIQGDHPIVAYRKRRQELMESAK